MTKQLYTVRQVSQVFQVSEKFIRDWCNDGYFPSAQKLGRGQRCHWRISSDDEYLSEFMENNSISVNPVVAQQDHQIAELQNQVAEMDAKYNHLMSVYNGCLEESKQLDQRLQDSQKEVVEVTEELRDVIETHNELVRTHRAVAVKLQKYQEHYKGQKEGSRTAQRKAA